MACLTLGLTPPTLPSIFLPSGIAVNVSFGTVGITCCHYTIPGVRASIPIPIDAVTLNAAVKALNAVIKAQLAILRQIQIPDCPTE